MSHPIKTILRNVAPGGPGHPRAVRATQLGRMISLLQSRIYALSGLSTHFHKYGDVCWERDGAQIEARRRVDAGTSARRSNKKMGPSRPNHSGGWRLRAISLSLVVVDVPASTPPLFATSPRKPYPQTLLYL